MAAQESLELAERSAATQAQLLDIAEAGLEAEEISASDVDQVRARVAATQAYVAQARQSLLHARLQMSTEIGFEVEEIEDAPLASESLPAPDQRAVASLRSVNLVEAALNNRDDLKAARALRESAAALAEAARRDLKRRTDLSVVLAYSALDEGHSPLSPDGWAQGLDGVLTGGMVGPSGQVNLSIDWPFKNNVAKGKFAEARATQQRAEIDARNLERLISARVEQLVGQLRQAAAEVERLERSAEYYRKTIEDEIERFKAGEATAVDVVLTEEQETSALLSVVAAKQAYATLLLELRFELGVLVDYRLEDSRIVVEGVDPTGYSI